MSRQPTYRSLSEKIGIEITDNTITFIFRDDKIPNMPFPITLLPHHEIINTLTQEEKDNLLKYMIEYRDKYNPPNWVEYVMQGE